MVAPASVRMPIVSTPTAPVRSNSSSTMGNNPSGRSRPYHSFGQCGAPQPESINLLRHSTSPKLGSQFCASQARTSARTASAIISLMLPSSSHLPDLHQTLAMIGGAPEQYFGALRALEPEMGVVVPGEPDAAMNLHGVNGGSHIGLGGRRLRQRCQGRYLIINLVGGGGRIICCGLGKLHVQQHVSGLMLQ